MSAAGHPMKRGAPPINHDDDWDDADAIGLMADGRAPRGVTALPGRFADGQPTHRHPRWGGGRRGSGRKPQDTPSAAQYVKLGVAVTPRHVALLDVHRVEFEIASRSASLRTILDDYIAGVPGLADVLDHIATRRARP
jgi:hypothetical protein